MRTSGCRVGRPPGACFLPLPLMPVLSVFRGAPKEEGFTARPHVQRQKPDAVAAFNTNLASILRILVNVTFLFDAAKYPQHAR